MMWCSAPARLSPTPPKHPDNEEDRQMTEFNFNDWVDEQAQSYGAKWEG